MSNPRRITSRMYLRSDARHGLHFMRKDHRGLPVGSGGILDQDPTADHSAFIPLYRPPLNDPREPVSSSSSSDCDTSCATGNQYTVTMSGLAGLCCTQFNRTWTMSHVSGGTDYREEITLAACFPLGPTVWGCRLFLQTGNWFVQFYLGPFSAASLRVLYGPVSCFSCESGAVFPFQSVVTCTGAPASVTVTKV